MNYYDHVDYDCYITRRERVLVSTHFRIARQVSHYTSLKPARLKVLTKNGLYLCPISPHKSTEPKVRKAPSVYAKVSK